MDKEKIRAYFQAYRARINDLEGEVGNLSCALDDAESRYAGSVSKMRTRMSCIEDDLRTREYDQWTLEDRLKELERR